MGQAVLIPAVPIPAVARRVQYILLLFYLLFDYAVCMLEAMITIAK